MKNRLYKIAETKRLSIRTFESECDLGRGNISNMKEDAAIGSDKLTKIIDRFNDINAEWLLTGKGEMLKKHDVLNQNDCLSCVQKDQFIDHLKQEIAYLRQKVDDLTPKQNLQEALKKAI